MFYLPFIGALALALITIREKIALNIKNLKIKTLHTFAFLSSALIMLPLLYFFWDMKPSAYTLPNILIFFLVIIVSIGANLLAFYALRGEKVSNIEPAKMLEPLFTILLALIFSFFFSQELFERNFNIIIPALIASLALIFAHIKKSHLKFNKYFLVAVAGSFLFALELVLSRLILKNYSPLTFYFLRCASIFLLSFIFLKPNLKNTKAQTKFEIFGIGMLWVIFRLSVYYGYIYLGVIFTTLIIMLAPIFIYLFSWKYLKEKINWKNILASIIIIACVLYAILS